MKGTQLIAVPFPILLYSSFKHSFDYLFNLFYIYAKVKGLAILNIILNEDVETNLSIQLKAFAEYATDPTPSSALDESVEQINEELQNGTKILTAIVEGKPVATVRFLLKAHLLYFYRLSVLPAEQGKGYAKQLITKLEDFAKQQGLNEVQCNVRYNVPRNLYLYTSIDYQIIHEYDVIKPNGAAIKTVTMAKKI